MLSRRDELGDHPVVSVIDKTVLAGALQTKTALVLPPSAIGDFDTFTLGTAFLTQFHNDMGALLDAQLSLRGGDRDLDPTDEEELRILQAFTQSLLLQIVARFEAALRSAGQPMVPLLVFLGDPVSINLVDSEGRSFVFDLKAPVDKSLK